MRDQICQQITSWMAVHPGPVTRLEISNGARMPRSAVDHHFHHLIQDGFVAPADPLGRPGPGGAILWVPGPVQPPADHRCPLHKAIMPVTSVRFWCEPEDGGFRAVVVHRCLLTGCLAEVTEEAGDESADVPLPSRISKISGPHG